MKKSEVKVELSAKAAPDDPRDASVWSQWVEAVLENTQQLKQRIEEEDWEGVQVKINARGGLFEKLPSLLKALDGSAQSKEGSTERQRTRRYLEHLLSLNNEFQDKLAFKMQAKGRKINEVKRGRKALGLYKPPRPAQPRFLNRFG